MDKNENKITFKEAFKLNFRGLKLMYKENPQMILSMVFSNIFWSISPFFAILCSAKILDAIGNQNANGDLWFWVITVNVGGFIFTVLSAVFARWQETSRAPSEYIIKENFFRKKRLEMDFCVTERQSTRDLRTQIRQSENLGGWGLGKIIWQFIPSVIGSITAIISSIFLTFTLFTLEVTDEKFAFLNSPLTILVIIVAMIFVTLIPPACVNRVHKYWTDHVETGKLGNRLFSYFGFKAFDKDHSLDMRIYPHGEICVEKFAKRNIFGNHSVIAKKARGPMGFLAAVSSAVSSVFGGTVYVFVGLKALGGAFGVGAVTQYVASTVKFAGAFSNLLQTISGMKANARFLGDIFQFLDMENEMYQGSLTTEKRSDREYDVEFRNVSFKYPNSNIYALKDVSVKFQIGKKLAVVGENGSGKTTFIKLLCRLYDPSHGEILLNGINIKKYNYRDYIGIFSVVFQDFNLLAYSLGENVATAVNYDRERAKKCLEDAGFGERLGEMKNGLDTSLYKYIDKDGVEISGGEAQKIALARTLYKDAPFIVLDEPTAALDPIAESEVYENFNQIIGDKTAIYISHRLSSCKFCDEIMVFEDGTVCDQGTHEELLEKEGKYNSLWYAQAKYYKTCV